MQVFQTLEQSCWFIVYYLLYLCPSVDQRSGTFPGCCIRSMCPWVVSFGGVNLLFRLTDIFNFKHQPFSFFMSVWPTEIWVHGFIHSTYLFLQDIFYDSNKPSSSSFVLCVPNSVFIALMDRLQLCRWNYPFLCDSRIIWHKLVVLLSGVHGPSCAAVCLRFTSNTD